MTRVPFILLAVLAAASAQAAPPAGCHPDEAAQRYPSLAGKTVRMGADTQTPPYANLDPSDPSKLIGSDLDLARDVFDCVGLKYSIQPAAWSGLMPAIVAGQMDLMYYLYYSPTRAQQVDFVVYMKAGTGAITQSGNPKDIKSIDDLCGKTVAVGLGSVEEAQMHALSDKCKGLAKPEVNVMTYPDHAAGFRLVASRRADIMLTDLALVDKTVQDNPQIYVRAFGIVSGFQIGVAVKKGNTELAQAILDGIKAMQADGVQKEIFVKYGIDPSLALPAELKTQ